MMRLILCTMIALFVFARSIPCVAGPPEGQKLIDEGKLKKALSFYSEMIVDDPLDIEGYRGRMETLVLMKRYADALADFSRVNAVVLPLNPTAIETLLVDYESRIQSRPNSIPALSGASFLYWCTFDYETALSTLDKLLDRKPNNEFGVLFRGSASVLSGIDVDQGLADLQRSIQRDRRNPHVRFIVADAYTYGFPDPDRAFLEANTALCFGLDTPRLRAILAASYLAYSDFQNAAIEIETHISLVTEEYVPTLPLASGGFLILDMVPYRTFVIPVTAQVGDVISLSTDSPTGEIYDTIMVLLDPSGSPATASDDANDFFAALEWEATVAGTYYLQVTSFEAIGTGQVVVLRN